MEFYGLTFSEYTTFDVINVEDYHVEGSFDPAAVSDFEFYGYRETTFKVVSAQGKDRIGYWPFGEDELEYFIENNNDAITLIVQNAIDDKQDKDIGEPCYE